jgi:predicted transport protein
LLRDRPSSLVLLYGSLEDTVRSLGEVEIVTRERYALFRTTRIFADLTVMRDALRLVIHLDREVRVPCFFKVQRGSPNRVAHVTLLRSVSELPTVVPYLEEAYCLAASEEMAGKRRQTVRRR